MMAALLAAGMLVSCGGPDTGATNGGTNTSGGASGSLVTGISGKVVEGVPTYDASHSLTGFSTRAWSYGAGTFSLVSDTNANRTTLASTPMAADGSFSMASLPVPAIATLTPYRENPADANCTDTTVVSDKSFNSYTATGLVTVAQGSQTAVPVEISVSGTVQTENIWMLIYVDRPFTMSGTRRCMNTSYPKTTTTTVNINLQKGWNSVKAVYTTNAATSEGVSSLTNAALPTQWFVGVH